MAWLVLNTSSVGTSQTGEPPRIAPETISLRPIPTPAMKIETADELLSASLGANGLVHSNKTYCFHASYSDITDIMKVWLNRSLNRIQHLFQYIQVRGLLEGYGYSAIINPDRKIVFSR